jgi:outer membrane protein OmpA-like peptidoglycan-associated protein
MKLMLRIFVLLSMSCWAFSSGFAQSSADGQPMLSPASTAAAADPAPANNAENPHIKPGTDFPHEELFLGYSYVHFSPGGGLDSANLNGGSASFAYNFTNYFGLVGDFGGYHTGSYQGEPIDGTIYSYLFGPRFSYRNDTRLTPFAQILLGGAHGSADISGATTSRNGFAMTAGWGLDAGLTDRLAIRLFQVEYFLTRFNPGNDLAGHQNNLRVSSGLVVRWGRAPEMINQVPTASCSADPSAVTIGSNETVTFNVNASDPDGDALTYGYSASGGQISGTGPSTRWEYSGLNPGDYTINARVDDGHGGNASCSASVRVNPRPNRPPTVSLSADRDTILVGECVHLTATGSDPDGDTLGYSWRANGGQLTPSGTTATLCTTGVTPGTYSATVRVDDGRGGAADASKAINVQAPPPPPQASKINECQFKPANSVRVDNICKRILDDVALRLQSEPRGRLVIVGYSNPRARRAEQIATNRGENASKYLQQKGIDATRITVHSGSGQVGAGTSNQRVDLIWVPEGATY